MLGTYARSTVSAHLSTIRARYREILHDDGTRDALYAMASEQFSHAGKHDTPANRKAYVDGLLTELNNAIDHAPRRSRPRCRTGRRARGPA
jgi:hypothetical protein